MLRWGVGVRSLTPLPWASRPVPEPGFFSTSRALIPTPNGVLLFCHAPKCGGVFGVGIGSLFLMVNFCWHPVEFPGAPAAKIPPTPSFMENARELN